MIFLLEDWRESSGFAAVLAATLQRVVSWFLSESRPGEAQGSLGIRKT
jgi:hypothetical protein